MPGAGDNTESITDCYPPFPTGTSSFEVVWGANKIYQNSTNFTIIQTGTTVFTMKSRLNNFLSDAKTITVEAANGTYKS